MKLSIAVITMNRSSQVVEALDSCLACSLPNDTEFVVIDNASTDDTEQAVRAKLDNCGYSYYYEKLPENLGVGGGRNYAYNKTNGDYVYVLDDDAVISPTNLDFFTKAIDILDEHEDIATLTTQIYDEAWERDRVEQSPKKLFEGIYKMMMFCGGSHFLRKSFFADTPYFSNKYGYEEIVPSCRVYDAGLYNVFCPNLLIIHKPKVNKWNYNDKDNSILVKSFTIMYVIKSRLYPRIFKPMAYFIYKYRRFRYARGVVGARKIAKEIRLTTKSQAKGLKRIKLKTVFKMYKDFGLSVF